MTTESLLSAPTGSVPLRWLWRQLLVAYALCPAVTALIVALGRGHRVAALILLFTAIVSAHAYILVCAIWALVLAPTSPTEATSPFWDDTPIIGLLSLPVLFALSRFADEPTRTAGMAAVAVLLVLMLVRSYRNGFKPPTPRTNDRDGPDGTRG
jgi:hypothetical protein